MASQAKLDDISKAKKKQKMFGAMTTSRWIGVCIFLCGILYSYTSGAPLERLWRLNFYIRDYRLFDLGSLRNEGSAQVIDSVFATKYFSATRLQQIASSLGQVEQMVWSEEKQKLYFVDPMSPMIFSYHTLTGLDFEYEFNSTKASKTSKSVHLGPSGIAIDVKDSNSVYISELSLNRIVQLNLKSGKKTLIADSYDGKPLNGPGHLTVNPSKNYLYFTEPLSSSVYRVKLNAGSGARSVELVTKEVKHPTHVAFSIRQPNRVFVGNCIEGDYSVYVFEIDKSERWTLKKEWNFESLQWKNSSIKGQAGCVRGLTPVHGFLLVTCPGGRVCIVNEQTGIMNAAVKLYDGVVLNDIVVTGHHIWMGSNFSFWRSYLQKDKKTDL